MQKNTRNKTQDARILEPTLSSETMYRHNIADSKGRCLHPFVSFISAPTKGEVHFPLCFRCLLFVKHTLTRLPFLFGTKDLNHLRSLSLKVTKDAAYRIQFSSNKLFFNYLPHDEDLHVEESTTGPMEPESKRQKTDEMME